jgi:hypothetical protein
MNCWMQSLLQTCQDSSPENSSSNLDITLEDRLMTLIRWIPKKRRGFCKTKDPKSSMGKAKGPLIPEIPQTLSAKPAIGTVQVMANPTIGG